MLDTVRMSVSTLILGLFQFTAKLTVDMNVLFTTQLHGDKSCGQSNTKGSMYMVGSVPITAMFAPLDHLKRSTVNHYAEPNVLYRVGLIKAYDRNI